MFLKSVKSKLVTIPKHETSCVTCVFCDSGFMVFLEVNPKESPAGFFLPDCEVHALFSLLSSYVCISESL